MPKLSRPNILLVVLDSFTDLDNKGTNCGSRASIPTPTLHKLFNEGAQFTQTYTPCPESSPARASLFTGLDPCVHGLWTNGVKLPSHVRTFPETLSQVGYTNWLVGRWQLAGVSNWTTEAIRAGTFDHVYWAHGPLHRSRQNAYLAWLQQQAPQQYARIFSTQANADDTSVQPEQFKSMSALPDNLSFNHWVAERTGELISAQPPDQPFLAICGFSVGTSMGTEPRMDCDGESLSERALQQADAALKTILDVLIAENSTDNRADDTAIIVTSARGNVETGTSIDAMREQAIRVPLLVHHSTIKKQVINQPVSTIDIAPSVLDFAGVSSSSSIQGNSLLKVLNGNQPPRAWAMSRMRKTESNGTRRWRSALCVNNMKLVVSHGNPQTGAPTTYKLFDLEVDPGEQQDLATNLDHLEALEAMMDLMIDARCALEDRTEPRIAKF